jgi:hypothetical protein
MKIEVLETGAKDILDEDILVDGGIVNADVSDEPIEIVTEADIKYAYPNSEYMLHIPGQHNTDKWLVAVRELYTKEKDGLDRTSALSQATANWSNNEKLDFKNWLRFYEEGNHLKYKFAQNNYYLGDDPGYFLSIRPDPIKSEAVVSGSDINSVKEKVSNELTDKERKEIINKQRKKVISRLDSIEKLLRSDDGSLFAGKELESLMEAIFGLKKKVSTLNKVSTSNKMYQDMIIREANVLVKRGYFDAAELLFALADDPAAAAAAANVSPAPNPMTGSDTAGGSGSAGGLPASIPAQPNAPEAPKNDNSPTVPATPPDPTAPPSTANMPPTPIPPLGGAPPVPGTPPIPAMPAAPAAPAAPKEPKSPGITSFLKGLKGVDSNSIDELEVYDEDNLSIDDELIVEAQLAPEPAVSSPAPALPAMTPAPVAPVTEPAAPSLEVSEDEVTAPAVDKSTSPSLQTFDNKVNEIFSKITVEDIISKLEDLSKIFKVREVPRQLAIVDMMLDSLGLASYFPDLSEATNKALESNNYISTRIDTILSKLHGATQTKEINLYGDSLPSTSPQIDAIKKNLESGEVKEKIRKQVRKDQEINEALSRVQESPEIEIDEDLMPAPPAPALPPAPVAPAPAVTPPPVV